MVQFVGSWGEDIKKATGGRVEVEIYPSATLIDRQATIEGIKKGRADLSWACTLYWRGRFPLSEVLALPFLGVPTGEAGSRILWRLTEEFPEVAAEYAGMKLLYVNFIGPYVLCTKKPVTSLEDVRGLKVRAGGGGQTEVMKTLEGVPSYLGFADLYPALEKGVMDGALLPWEAIGGFKFYEVVDYVLDEPFSSTNCFVVMNQESWDSLPPDIQKIIGRLSYEKASAAMGQVCDLKALTKAEVITVGSKLDIRTLHPAARAEWVKKLGPIWDTWADDAEAAGLPARKILDRTLELAKEMSQ